MPDIKTYDGFKNWLLIGAIGVIFSLLGILAADNRQRIEKLEIKYDVRGEVIESLISKVTRMETIQDSQRDEVFRRLGRIEDKIDKYSENKYGENKRR